MKNVFKIENRTNRQREREHECGWVGRWGESRRGWGREKNMIKIYFMKTVQQKLNNMDQVMTH